MNDHCGMLKRCDHHTGTSFTIKLIDGSAKLKTQNSIAARYKKLYM